MHYIVDRENSKARLRVHGFKKSCRTTFLVEYSGMHSTAVEWWHSFRQGNTNFGRTKQWGRREPSSWKTRLNTHRWKHINKTLGKCNLEGGSSWHWLHLYQPMNRNHNALPEHKGLWKLLLKPNVLQFSHHCQGCPSLQTYCIQPQFSHNTSVQCGSWIKCYMIMQPLVTKQLGFFWMNQGNLCLNENERCAGRKQNLRISAYS